MPSKAIKTETFKKQVVKYPPSYRIRTGKKERSEDVAHVGRKVAPKSTEGGSATNALIADLNAEFNPDDLPSVGEFIGSETSLAMAAKRGKSKSRTSSKSKGTKRKSSTKKTSSKRRKPAGMSAHVAKNIAGMLNPFAHADGIQVPDGAVPSSLGRFFRNVFQIEAPYYTTRDPDEEQTDGTAHIMIYPGLHAGCMWAYNRPGGEDEFLNNIRYSHENQTFLGQLTASSPSDDTNGYYNTIPATGAEITQAVTDGKTFNEPFGKLFLDDDLVKWRIASQGLRLKLLNASENNDGWFEAIRVSYKIDNRDWTIGGAATVSNGGTKLESYVSPTADGMKFGPSDQMIDRLESQNWAENKSYVCDSLKNIHRYSFNLETYTGQNMFKDMRRQYETHRVLGSDKNQVGETPSWPDTGNHGMTFPFVEGEEDATEMIRSFVDADHDIVMIRIHPGRGSADTNLTSDSGSGGANLPLNSAVLLAEHVANQEIVYETDSPNAALMKDAPVAVAATAKAQAIKKEQADTVASMDTS